MIKTKKSVLPVMEMFYSIQGEGYNTGTPAFFIRLAGCDVGCHWCDVKDSWNSAPDQNKSIEEIVSELEKSKASVVIVTGGEPLMHDLSDLCTYLKSNFKTVLLETSGAYPLSGTFDWICLSPKKFKAPLPELISVAHELKVVVFNKSDFEWAERYAQQVNANCHLFLQPEWSVAESVQPMIIEYIKNHPKWKISLQTHKWLQIR